MTTNTMSKKTRIITEGKTDWIHLKKALERFRDNGVYKDLNIEFEEYKDIGAGEKTIDNLLKSIAKLENETAYIFIFDRDTPKYVNDYGKTDFVRVIDKDYSNRLKEKLEKHFGCETSEKYIKIYKNNKISRGWAV